MTVFRSRNGSLFSDLTLVCPLRLFLDQYNNVYLFINWVLGVLLGSVGHRVKIHIITTVTDKERGDIETKDYVVSQKPQTQDNRLPPPRTLIMDYTMTHTRFGRSHLHPMGQLRNSRQSDGSPEPDGDQSLSFL